MREGLALSGQVVLAVAVLVGWVVLMPLGLPGLGIST